MHTKKATRYQIKRHNTQLVLRQIYDAQGISRADIARATHLTPPSVSAIVRPLMREGLVEEGGMGPSAGGKRPILLQFNAQARHILCIDLGNQIFRGALIDMRGAIVERITLPAEDLFGEIAIQVVRDLVQQLLSACSTPVLGIGIGTPGIIQPEKGIVRLANNLDWQDVPIKKILQAFTELPIYLTNDSQAAALGEYSFGKPHASRHLLLIKMGQGVGSGIVINGESFYGDGFGAGEIGHLIVRQADSSLVTLESEISTRVLLARARALTHGQFGWEDFVTAVSQDQPQLSNLIVTAGRHLGAVIAHLITTLNIQNIVLSGRLNQFGEPFWQAIQQEAQRRVLPVLFAGTTIRESNLGANIVLMGCAALLMKQELGVI